MTFEEIVRMEARQAEEEGREEGREEGVAQGQQSMLAKFVKDGAITMENAVLNGYVPEAK